MCFSTHMQRRVLTLISLVIYFVLLSDWISAKALRPSDCGYLSCEFYPPGSAASSLPSLPQPVNFPGGKVHTYTPANSISDGPITNRLSVLCSFDRSPFTCSCEWGKRLWWFKISYFYWSFSERRRSNHGSEGVKLSCLYLEGGCVSLCSGSRKS